MSAPFLDWPGLMRLGLHGMGLRPAEFWALTPAELVMMLGLERAESATMGRARLNEMIAAYPDGTAREGARDGGI